MPTYAVAEHNHKLVVSPTLMERFDYDVTIINDGGVSEVKNSERLRIDLVEGGSIISLIKGNKVLFTIPIRDIIEVAATSHATGKIRKGNDFVIEVIFHDRDHNKRSIVINVEDQHVNRIQQQISAIKDSELGIKEVIWGELDKLVRFALRTSLSLNLEKKMSVCTVLKKSMGEYHSKKKRENIMAAIKCI